jgi:hypothetical protein
LSESALLCIASIRVYSEHTTRVPAAVDSTHALRSALWLFFHEHHLAVLAERLDHCCPFFAHMPKYIIAGNIPQVLHICNTLIPHVNDDRCSTLDSQPDRTICHAIYAHATRRFQTSGLQSWVISGCGSRSLSINRRSKRHIIGSGNRSVEFHL